MLSHLKNKNEYDHHGNCKVCKQKLHWTPNHAATCKTCNNIEVILVFIFYQKLFLKISFFFKCENACGYRTDRKDALKTHKIKCDKLLAKPQ
jgi:hypothetical protein